MGTAPWTLSFIGTGSWQATSSRGFPSIRIEADGTSILIDCGDGTLHRLLRHRRLDLDVVLLTTASSPELNGLLALAEAYRRERQKPLRVAGPAGIASCLNLMSRLTTTRESLFDVEELASGQAIRAIKGLHLESIELEANQVPCLGYLLIEPPPTRRFDKKAVERHNIQGKDFGLLASGQSVRGVRPSDVLGPQLVGRRVVVCGRGRPSPSLAVALEGADVAVLAAPYMDERLEHAVQFGYMTGWEAAQIAHECRVKEVHLYQLATHARDREHLAEARQFHPNVHAPRDGMILEIPLAGSGSEPSRNTLTFERQSSRKRNPPRR